MKEKTKSILGCITIMIMIGFIVTILVCALIKDSACDDYICARLTDGTIIKGMGRMIMYSDYAKFELDGHLYYLNSKDVTVIENYADD